jgi:hypothetical protein
MSFRIGKILKKSLAGNTVCKKNPILTFSSPLAFSSLRKICGKRSKW